MVHGLGVVELAHRWEDTVGVAGQEDDVLGVAAEGGDLGVVDVFEGVGSTGVLGDRRVEVVHVAGAWVEAHVLQHCPEFNGLEDFSLLLPGQTNGFGVTAAFHIENTPVAPHMLIITDEHPLRVSTERSFARPRESEEQRHISTFALIGARMEGQVTLLGHEIIHDGEDPLLHFSGVLCAEDDHLPLLEIQSHRGDIGDALDVLVGVELSGVEDVVVGAGMEVGLEFLLGGADQHVVHEQSVVGTGAHHSDLDPEVLVPARVAVQHVQLG